MILLAFVITFLTFAGSPSRWEYARAIVERHEFYQNGEEITKPANTWQSLFAVSYLDSNFRTSKDCIFYRVPGEEPGKMKIRTLASDKDCTSEILSPGEIEIENISKLSFMTGERSASLDLIRDSKSESWQVSLLNDWKKPEPRLLLSSSDYNSPRMIYLAPAANVQSKVEALKAGTLCHDISADCQERSPSICSRCEGWTELPNGCPTGPKVCGIADCGGKDQPACRRGMVWQRKEIEPDCRIDTSFAWCSKGLSVNCLGDKAYCR